MYYIKVKSLNEKIDYLKVKIAEVKEKFEFLDTFNKRDKEISDSINGSFGDSSIDM